MPTLAAPQYRVEQKMLFGDSQLEDVKMLG